MKMHSFMKKRYITVSDRWLLWVRWQVIIWDTSCNQTEIPFTWKTVVKFSRRFWKGPLKDGVFFISIIFRELFYVGWFKLISNKLFGLHQKFMLSYHTWYMVTNWACSVSLALKVFLTMTDFALVCSWPLWKRFTVDWKSGPTSRVTDLHRPIEMHRARFWSSKISSIFQVWSVFRNVFWEFLISDVSKWLISKSWKI